MGPDLYPLRCMPHQVPQTVDLVVPRRDSAGNPICRQDIEGYLDDDEVPGGTGAMQSGNVLWELIRNKILKYPEDEEHLGITWLAVDVMSDDDIQSASEDDDDDSPAGGGGDPAGGGGDPDGSGPSTVDYVNEDPGSSSEDLVELGLGSQGSLTNRSIQEIRDALPDGALLGDGGYDNLAPPLNIGSDRQSVMLSGNLVTLEDAAIENRVRAVMALIGGNRRNVTLTGGLYRAVVRNHGYDDWEALTLSSHKAVLTEIEMTIRDDSTLWTRASRLAGGGRGSVQATINDLISEWEQNGAADLYGGDLDKARDRLRAHLESQYQSVAEFDADDYVDPCSLHRRWGR